MTSFPNKYHRARFYYPPPSKLTILQYASTRHTHAAAQTHTQGGKGGGRERRKGERGNMKGVVATQRGRGTGLIDVC